jgi:negative regulator of sigma E activity
MSEQEQISQLSALFDGELPSQQAEMVIRRTLKDPAMRARWERYAVIGACVRGDLATQRADGGVAERVRLRLAAEADILAPVAMAGGRSAGRRALGNFFGRSAMGGAIAATVAVMAVFVVRSLGPAVGDTNAMLAQSTTSQGATIPNLVAAAEPTAAQVVSAADDSAPHSYTTPGENAPVADPFLNQQPLAHYVVAHSEQAASSFGFSYDLTQGAVDMTQDEIEARR